MEVVTGVFESRGDAERAVNQLRSLGIPQDRIGLIDAGLAAGNGRAGVPVTDTEEPGMGRAMGAAVGGAMGAAGGATLGLAVATLAIPGVGPVIAFGMLGAALLGTLGAAAGAAVGDAIEERTRRRCAARRHLSLRRRFASWTFGCDCLCRRRSVQIRREMSSTKRAPRHRDTSRRVVGRVER